MAVAKPRDDPRDRSLRDIDAQLAQLAMDSGRAPQRIRGRHLVDERPNRGVGPRAAGLFLPGSLRPAASQPLAMPAHDGVCLHHEQGATPASPGPGEHDPEESIAQSKTRSLGGACQRSQLLAKRDILKRDGPVPATDQSDRSENHDQRRQA